MALLNAKVLISRFNHRRRCGYRRRLLSLVHTSDISISTRSIRKQSMIYPLGLVNTKQREFFSVSSFVLLLAYASTMFLCLCLCRSICRRLDCIPLFCLLFVLMLLLMALVWTRRKVPSITSQDDALHYLWAIKRKRNNTDNRRKKYLGRLGYLCPACSLRYKNSWSFLVCWCTFGYRDL